MDAPTGPKSFPAYWLTAVASFVPLTVAFTSGPDAPPGARDAPAAPAEASDAVAEPVLTPRPTLYVPPDPSRILVIGDSHTAGTFGRALDNLLRTLKGAEVKTVGSCGLSPDGFLKETGTRCGYLEIGDELAFRRRARKTPHVDDLLIAHHPDLTVIELGANQINTAARDPEGAARDIRELATRVLQTGSRCLWVGPPYGAPKQKPPERLDNIYRVLGEALPAGCSFLDSRPSAMPFLDFVAIGKEAGRRGDGKHFDTLGVFGQHAARQWARAVFAKAKRVLAEEAEARPEVVLAGGPWLAAY